MSDMQQYVTGPAFGAAPHDGRCGGACGQPRVSGRLVIETALSEHDNLAGSILACQSRLRERAGIQPQQTASNTD